VLKACACGPSAPQPRVKQAVRKLGAPREIVEDTQAWVKAKAPAARHAQRRVATALLSAHALALRRRSMNTLQDNARDVMKSKSLGEASGKMRALRRRSQDVRRSASAPWQRGFSLGRC